MSKEIQNSITVIFGKKGSGKSTLAKKLIKENKRKYLFIWDFLNEYSELGTVVKSPKEFFGLLESKNGTEKTFVCQEFTKDNGFDFFCYIAKVKENCLIVVEEVDYLCSPSYISEDFSNLIRYGRHYAVDIIAISRRPAEVSRLLTSQADNIFCFKFLEPRDLKYLNDYANFSTQEIQTLGKYAYKFKSL